MKANGMKMIKKVVEASMFGLMGPFMKATLKTAKPIFMVD